MGRSWHPESDRRKLLFVEWVYFKFFSPVADGIIVYGCGNGFPGAMSVQLFPRNPDGDPIQLVRHDFRADQVRRSERSHDATVGDCTLREDPSGYQIVGTIRRGVVAVSWDLRFDRRVPAQPGFDGAFGVLWFDSIGWTVLAPLAQVHGTVTVGDGPLEVDGHGYVDTNWGRWLFAIDTTTHWNWLMAYEPAGDTVVVGMNLRSEPAVGRLVAAHGGEVCRFPCQEATFLHTAFARDERSRARYPIRTEVHARNRNGDQLDLVSVCREAQVYDEAIPPRRLRGPLPTPFRWALVECFVQVEGEVRRADGHRWQIRGTGIQEYPVTCLQLAPRVRVCRDR